MAPAEGERRDGGRGVVARRRAARAGRRTPPAPRRRGGRRWPWPRRAAAGRGAGSRGGPRPAPPRPAGSAASAAGVGQRSSHCLVDGQHPGDRRLLQHELRDQHRPRAGVRTAPRQVARVRVVPPQHRLVKLAHWPHCRGRSACAAAWVRRGAALAVYRAKHAVDDAGPAALRGLLAAPAGPSQPGAGAGPRDRQGALAVQRRVVRRLRHGDAGRRRAVGHQSSKTPGDRKSGKPGKGKPSKTPSTTPSPTPPPLPQPSGPCQDSDVLVTPVVDEAVAAQPVTIVLNFQTGVSEACTWPLSSDSVP